MVPHRSGRHAMLKAARDKWEERNSGKSSGG